MNISEIIIVIIVVIAMILTCFHMYRKGIRANSPIAKLMGRNSKCKSANCDALLKRSDLEGRCEFHEFLIKAKKEYKSGNKKEYNIKKIEKGLLLNSKVLSKKQKEKYKKEIF